MSAPAIRLGKITGHLDLPAACVPLTSSPTAAAREAKDDKEATITVVDNRTGGASRSPTGRGLVLDNLKANNKAWARGKTKVDPDFFSRLVRQQAPEYLWIGCADSRVPANEIVGLDPGELFVHRNVANLAPLSDSNYLAVLQYAVEVLKVKHVIVVGHYGCGGVRAAVEKTSHGLIDHWLSPIRDVSHEYRTELGAIENEHKRLDRLCELNVIRQVRNVASNPFVTEAWDRGQKIAVHGWVYCLSDGLVSDLNVSVHSREEFAELFLKCPAGTEPASNGF